MNVLPEDQELTEQQLNVQEKKITGLNTVERYLNSYLSNEFSKERLLDCVDPNATVILIRNKKSLLVSDRQQLSDTFEWYFLHTKSASIIYKNITSGDNGLYMCKIKSIQYRDDSTSIVTDNQIMQVDETSGKIKFLQHNWFNVEQ